MTDTYDVVIAGAGPAGGQCARDLAARDYSVLVLETEPEEQFPRTSNKSTAGTFPSTMASFNVPDAVVQHRTDSVVLESPNDHFEREQAGFVLDFGAFKQWLVDDGREKGAEYRFGARVTEPIVEDGDPIGVRYNGDEEVYGEVIVDATGPSAPLATELGVTDLKRDRQAIGIEYEMAGVEPDHPDYGDLRDAMMLRLDHSTAPGGYAWIFHTGGDTAKVGLCYIQNERHRERAREDTTIDGYLTEWIDSDPRLSDATRIEEKQQHRGSAHIQPPSSMSTDNFMAIGDTVPTVDPLWGEGIAKCMRSGRAAAVTVDNCPSLADTGAEQLSLYDDLWERDVAPNVKKRLLMTELLYFAGDERYDRLMRDLRRNDDDTLARANQGNPLAISRLLHLGDVPLLVDFARDRIEARGGLTGAIPALFR
ncbi:MAG: digeranylgeranylglycerophospholipid reductase [Haloarculaceae archaeon]